MLETPQSSRCAAGRFDEPLVACHWFAHWIWGTTKNPLANCKGVFSGAQNRNRTSDTGLFSPLLYQLSYLGRYLVFKYMVGLQGLEPGTRRL